MASSSSASASGAFMSCGRAGAFFDGSGPGSAGGAASRSGIAARPPQLLFSPLPGDEAAASTTAAAGAALSPDDVEEQLEWEEFHAQRGFTFAHHMVAGSFAGVAEHLCMYPVDTFKTHIQASHGPVSAQPSFADFLRRDGFFRMWRGAPAVALGSVPSHAAYFSTYEAMKEALGANRPGHHPLAAALTGALATTVHDFVATPMDVVKQRLQLGYYRGVVHCVRSMAAEEGVRSLWRSYPTTLLMNMPYAAVVVAANESLKKLLVPITGPLSVTTYLLSGAGAGALAAAATCPLDVIKTRLQTQGVLGGSGGGGSGGSGDPLMGGPGGLRGGNAANATSPAAATAPAASASASSASSSVSAASSSALRAAATKAVWSAHGLGGGGSGGGGRAPAAALGAQIAMLYTQPSSRLHKALGARGVARDLLREEGIGAFFRGVRARVAIHAPSQAISWATYEYVKRWLGGASPSDSDGGVDAAARPAH